MEKKIENILTYKQYPCGRNSEKIDGICAIVSAIRYLENDQIQKWMFIQLVIFKPQNVFTLSWVPVIVPMQCVVDYDGAARSV